VHLADGQGNPVTIPRAICIHEEDDGILWKVKGDIYSFKRKIVEKYHQDMSCIM
jgi:Cu2+-containing amine oxidase